MDCTLLTFMDNLGGESASFFARKNQVSGNEQQDSQEGNCSAAPVAQNEFSLNSAIANQTPELIEQASPAMFTAENLVSRDEDKANHEGEGSAAPVPSAEKWSHEAKRQ